MTNRSDRIHYHWIFGAFDGDDPRPEIVKFGVTVTVVGYPDEETAEVAARSIIKREHFILTQVSECPQCGFNDTTIENQRQLVEAFKDVTR